jgi:hypothetical protein
MSQPFVIAGVAFDGAEWWPKAAEDGTFVIGGVAFVGAEWWTKALEDGTLLIAIATFLVIYAALFTGKEAAAEYTEPEKSTTPAKSSRGMKFILETTLQLC